LAYLHYKFSNPELSCLQPPSKNKQNKMLSYRRETALQGALVLAKSGRLELEDNIFWTLYLQPL